MTTFDLRCKSEKLDLIERAFDRFGVKSFVDLGACWGVNGGYTFHALERGGIDRAIIVDGRITELTRQRAEAYPQLDLIQGSLGAPDVIQRVGVVDCAIMYDILLHQVAPDWNELLALYADNVGCFVIYNQNWIGDPRTVRFIDFGLDGYLERVFHTSRDAVHEWFSKHEESNAAQKRPWRDVHNFWQWGITQNDLVSTLWQLGFRVDFLNCYGKFSADFPEIYNDGLICVRR